MSIRSTKVRIVTENYKLYAFNTLTYPVFFVHKSENCAGFLEMIFQFIEGRS